MKRNLLLLSSFFLSLAVFNWPIRQLITMSLYDSLYSHIPLIVIISGFFLYWDRKAIFSSVGYNVLAGLVATVVAAATAITGLIVGPNLNPNDYLSLLTLSLLLTWISIFIIFYGLHSFKQAVFPLLFLLFIVPLPYLVQKPVVSFLQDSSVEVANVLFSLIMVPAVLDGYMFHLPGLSIEVTEECSGIRSFMALVIMSVIAAKLFLSKGWTRILAVLLMAPIALLKNAIRIVTLSVLGAYVDFEVLSILHKIGGFFVLSLVLLWAVIAILRKVERSLQPANKAIQVVRSPKV